MMQDEKIWKLLARKMNGEATEAELKELLEIMNSDPVMRHTAETFSRLWNALSNPSKQANSPKPGTRGGENEAVTE